MPTRRGWIVRSHTGEGNETFLIRPDTRRYANEDVGPSRRVDCEIPHWVGEGNETFLIRLDTRWYANES